MKIDGDIEPLVREALARSVTAEREEFEDALEALAVNDDTASRAVSLAVAIDSAALWAVHQGRPDDAQLRSLAYTFANTQPWSDIDPVRALAFLTALAEGISPLELLSPSDVALASFTMGGWLLSAFLPEGAQWIEFLNAIELSLESAS